MYLREQVRLRHGECFVCRYMGEDVTIWPLEPVLTPAEIAPGYLDSNPNATVRAPEYTDGTWRTYVSVHTLSKDIAGRLRSSHRTITVCPDHWRFLWYNWQQVAHDEVELHDIWFNYIDRTER